MKIPSAELIDDLIERTRLVINEAEQLNQLSFDQLNKKSEPNKWTALECIEHLNYYGIFYLPEIKMRIEKSNSKPETHFKSGLLGNYFAVGMLPKEKLNKMNTFKSMNPLNSKLTKEVLTVFLNQQQTMLKLLNQARSISLNKTKTSISISKLIKLKLGDTFRVVIYHNQRHLMQAFKAADI